MNECILPIKQRQEMDDDGVKKTGIPHRFFMTAYTFVNFVQQRAHKGAEKLYGKYNDLMKGYLKSDVVPAILKAKGDAKIKVVADMCNFPAWVIVLLDAVTSFFNALRISNTHTHTHTHTQYYP